VQPEDFRAEGRRPELIKFHGCAVRAAADEAAYRPRLIARKSQISGWTTKPENQLIKHRLEHLFASRPALVVGLSAQDANIHTVMHEANASMSRAWPASPPAVVLAEQHLSWHHRHVLRVTYGNSYSPHVSEIADSAVLGAYAKPALVALVLYTLAEKLSALAGCAADVPLPGAELELVRADIVYLRDAVGQLPGTETRGFVDALVSGMALAMSIFRTGRAPDPSAVEYKPISAEPIATARHNLDFPVAAFGRVALVVSALGRGLRDGRWTLAPGTVTSPRDGAIRLGTGRQDSRVFVVRDARATSQLEVDGLVDPDDDDVLVLMAEAPRAAATRSPRSRYGRTGRQGARYVDLENLLASVSTADELFEAFRLEGAL
jgi:hypothetical protein